MRYRKAVARNLRFCWSAVLLGAALCIGTCTADAPPQARERELRELLTKLHTTARLVQTTAHPDDEDGGVLTLESRGKGASVLLLTLDRGEGGQNKMGSNLLDVLGVLRTLELLASDKFYGVEQRFTRVADFGFSKNPEETFAKWQGHDIALGDMVRVIRTFRPDVLVSRFQGTARDGHGQHSAAGILTREAFRAAADPNRFPEQVQAGLAPWQARKLYIDNVRPPEEHTLELDTGVANRLLGMTYVQYAMQGLKHQLSQGAGSWSITPGPHFSYYKLVDSVLPAKPGQEQDFFDGIDTSVPGLATRLGAEEQRVPFLRPALIELANNIQRASTAADMKLESAGTPLLAGLQVTRDLVVKVQHSQLSAAAKADLLANLDTKRDQLQRAANAALGVELQATVEAAPATGPDDAFVAVPGESFRVTLRLVNHGTAEIVVRNIRMDVPASWRASAVEQANEQSIKPGGEARAQFEVAVPPNAELSRPYWYRRNPEKDAIYTLGEPQFATLPFPPLPVHAYADYALNGVSGTACAVAQVAYRDPSNEVHEMPLAVEPALSVALEPATQVIPLATQNGTDVQVTVQKNIASEIHSEVQLQLPAGWRAEPALAPLDMKAEIRRSTVKFHVTPGELKPGQAVITALVNSNGKTYSEGYTVVTRPDLPAFFYYQLAEQRVSIVDVRVPAGLKVGYIMGAGDDIPTVLRQVGMDVSLLSDQDLATGDLQRFDTIVVGIRAYDTRPEVRQYNSRLLDFVRAGGTLLVQYNAGVADFNAGHFTPYPAELGRERVTVEEAPVEVLTPQQAIFHFPNQITPADFQDWIQERGLYFMSTWDSRFEPLLESHDPGEAPLKGGLLRARYGKGLYLYTGYSFFRQLPAGIPGAIRLFVNLVSAEHEAEHRASTAVH